jgi:predicted metal-dependent hydrolase
MWPLKRGVPFNRQHETDPLLPIIIMVEGEAVAVMLRRHAKARRMTLRQSRDGEHFILTVPRRHNRKAAEAFLSVSAGWMAKTRARLPAAMPAVEGGSVLLRGEKYAIAASGRLRGVVAVNAAAHEVLVPGTPAHLKRRLIEWLKQEATKDLQEVSQRYASAMNVKVKRIGVRDQKSRWGSCNTDGVLSYSWRLVMAPPMVLDYVAAHEVAHLREMNHGPRFWRLVLSHCETARAAKAWLKLHGQSLHRMV